MYVIIKEIMLQKHKNRVIILESINIKNWLLKPILKYFDISQN
jgi:hypothetical protein